MDRAVKFPQKVTLSDAMKSVYYFKGAKLTTVKRFNTKLNLNCPLNRVTMGVQ
jgi:hypothetical protein